jgi:hypothetical protein
MSTIPPVSNNEQAVVHALSNRSMSKELSSENVVCPTCINMKLEMFFLQFLHLRQVAIQICIREAILGSKLFIGGYIFVSSPH